jgi:hypothetical protein
VERGIPVLVELPTLAKATLADGRRYVYFEASREGVIDREGEEVAIDALWRSKDLFLSQGNLDINHFSWLGNPYGTGARPEYVIGLPREVARQGGSVFVKGEIFSNATPPPPGSNGEWADWFWHSLTALNPPMRWFPSVFGQILPGGVEVVKRNGQTYRRITRVEWFSVGFAQRAQHPELPAVSLEPMGPLAKAAAYDRDEVRRVGGLRFTWSAFAKALSVGVPVTDSALKTGVQALTPTSLEGAVQEVLEGVLRGRVPPRKKRIARALVAKGVPEDRALAMAAEVLRRIGHAYSTLTGSRARVQRG